VLGFVIDAVLLWTVLIASWTPTSSVPLNGTSIDARKLTATDGN